MTAYVQAGNVRLHYRTDGHGSGPPLLLLNSLGTDLSLWDHQVGHWVQRRPIIRMDYRGQGSSSVPPPPYRAESFGRDVVAVLDRVEAERVDVCGLSLGGIVALWIGANFPERVRRLVFAATGTRIGDEALWQERADAVMAGGMQAVADQVIERFFSPRFRGENPETVSAVREHLLATDPMGYAGSCLALATADFRDAAAEVNVAGLVIGGGADVVTPPGITEGLSQALPKAQHVVVNGAGHLINLEAPDAFTDLVDGFLT